MVDTLKCMASKLSMELNLVMDLTQINIFRYLIDPALPFLANCTSQDIDKKWERRSSRRLCLILSPQYNVRDEVEG